MVGGTGFESRFRVIMGVKSGFKSRSRVFAVGRTGFKSNTENRLGRFEPPNRAGLNRLGDPDHDYWATL